MFQVVKALRLMCYCLLKAVVFGHDRGKGQVIVAEDETGVFRVTGGGDKSLNQ